MQTSKYAIIAAAIFAVIVFGYSYTGITGSTLTPSDKAACGNGWCEKQSNWLYINQAVEFCSRNVTLTNVTSCRYNACPVTLDVAGQSKQINKFGGIFGVDFEVKATILAHREKQNRAFVIMDEKSCCPNDCYGAVPIETVEE